MKTFSGVFPFGCLLFVWISYVVSGSKVETYQGERQPELPSLRLLCWFIQAEGLNGQEKLFGGPLTFLTLKMSASPVRADDEPPSVTNAAL